MREILFRVWDKKRKSMHIVNSIEFVDAIEGRPGYNVYVGEKTRELRWIEKEDGILMQFTGLLDRKGNKIFEGMKVRVEYGVGYSSKHYPSFADGTQKIYDVVIGWDNEKRGFSQLGEPHDMNFIKTFEIISDTPDLLSNP